MGEKKVIETIHGKRHKFEIVKEADGVFINGKFYVRKDGQPFKGPFSRLDDAVQSAKDQG